MQAIERTFMPQVHLLPINLIKGTAMNQRLGDHFTRKGYQIAYYYLAKSKGVSMGSYLYFLLVTYRDSLTCLYAQSSRERPLP